MMDNTARRRVISFIRKQFLWSDTYRAVTKRARIFPGVHKCEGCGLFICRDEKSMQSLIELTSDYNLMPLLGESYAIDKIAVDHIDPVGTVTSLDDAAAKIFCNINNLQLLCGFCHHSKTQIDNEETRAKKKSLLEKIEENEL
jgi:5-methylcytosine-specific restriction endonuclease McrA